MHSLTCRLCCVSSAFSSAHVICQTDKGAHVVYSVSKSLIMIKILLPTRPYSFNWYCFLSLYIEFRFDWTTYFRLTAVVVKVYVYQCICVLMYSCVCVFLPRLAAVAVRVFVYFYSCFFAPIDCCRGEGICVKIGATGTSGVGISNSRDSSCFAQTLASQLSAKIPK